MLNELSKFPLFANLSESSYQKLCQSGCYKTYHKDDVLVQEHVPNTQLFLLTEGSVRIESHDDDLIVVLRRGAIIGEVSTTGLSLLPIANAVAVNDVKVMAFPIQLIIDISAEEVEFADGLRDLG
ncbi:MAG: cyclic nucleotide-binding domain-containing protein, partial [Mariprofundaceae bacterium]